MEQPDLKYKKLIKTISKITEVGKNIISQTIFDYNNKGVLKSPNKPKIGTTISEKLTILIKMACVDKSIIFCFNVNCRQLKKMIVSVNEDPDLPNFSLQQTTLSDKGYEFEILQKKVEIVE